MTATANAALNATSSSGNTDRGSNPAFGAMSPPPPRKGGIKNRPYSQVAPEEMLPTTVVKYALQRWYGTAWKAADRQLPRQQQKENLRLLADKFPNFQAEKGTSNAYVILKH